MKSLGIDVDFENLSDDMLVEIENIVSEKLQKSGFDADYTITDKGKICEAILDKL
ncbi:MAG: hypothetical protein NC245_08210 [Muribaculum sp.]|nr:hypothetical protein [Muribaculum sp.]